MNRLIYIKHPKLISLILDKSRIIRIPDEKYLELLYFRYFNKILNLNNPQTFNEKLQWLKLYDRKPEYTTMVDKYEAKQYVKNMIGEEYIIPTLGIYEEFGEIEFNNLPNKFVLKCTHDSGTVVICENKETLDIGQTRKKINRSLKKNYYYYAREWPYKNIKPRIIIEKYMEDENEEDLKDYKFFCFNGKVQYILVCSNRNGIYKNTDFFDYNWNLMPFTREKHENNGNKISKPKNLEEMINVAEKLSKEIPFVRVDLYEINGKIYFGEHTFFPSAGFEGFKPAEWDKILGDKLELPTKKVEKI